MTHWCKSGGGLPRCWVAGAHDKGGEAERTVLVQAWAGEPPCCVQLLRGGWREDGARLFSEVHSGRTRGSMYELEHEEFWLDAVIYFSTVRVVQYWSEQVAQEGCSILHSGDTQNQPASGPEQPALLWPALSRRLDEVTSEGPFPPVWLYVAVRYFDAVSECKS